MILESKNLHIITWLSLSGLKTIFSLIRLASCQRWSYKNEVAQAARSDPVPENNRNHSFFEPIYFIVQFRTPMLWDSIFDKNKSLKIFKNLTNAGYSLTLPTSSDSLAKLVSFIKWNYLARNCFRKKPHIKRLIRFFLTTATKILIKFSRFS